MVANERCISWHNQMNISCLLMIVFGERNIPAFPPNIRCSHRNLDNARIRGTQRAAKHRLRKWERSSYLVIQVKRVNLQSDIQSYVVFGLLVLQSPKHRFSSEFPEKRKFIFGEIDDYACFLVFSFSVFR